MDGKQLSTKAQQQRIHILARKTGLDERDLRNLVERWSGSGSTKDLPLGTATNIIDYFEDKLDRQRKRVIANLKAAGMDMDQVHAWVKQQKYKKHLNEHTAAELSKLIYAAEKVKQHYYSKI